MMIKNNSLQEIADLIQEKTQIMITSHVSPDGDSVGSVIALGAALLSRGKKITMVMQDNVAKIYSFLPSINEISKPGPDMAKPDLLIFLDCSDASRAGDHWHQSLLQETPVINIDHHISNSFFGTMNYVDPDAGATCEIIWKLLCEVMSVTLPDEAANALYTGILQDTGSFLYQNTTAKTMRIVSSLMEDYGVNPPKIRESLFENKSMESYKVMALAINNLHTSKDQRLAWTFLDYASMQKIPAGEEDCEGIVNIPLTLKGAEMGILFKELRKDIIRVGLRCTSKHDVNKIASFFGGGGHKMAAGCTIIQPLEDAIPLVLNAALKEVEGK